MSKSWDDLPMQEQVRYEELVSRHFPTLAGKELEEKAKKYYESTKKPQ